jgi:hypothetical protein
MTGRRAVADCRQRDTAFVHKRTKAPQLTEKRTFLCAVQVGATLAFLGRQPVWRGEHSRLARSHSILFSRQTPFGLGSLFERARLPGPIRRAMHG